MVVLPAPVEGAMEAGEGGARQPGRLPERLMESSDAEDAELGLRALLRTRGVGGELLSALEGELLEEGDEDEVASRVLEQLLASDGALGEELHGIVEPPPVSAETCASRGWPVEAFSACQCMCMQRLAASERGGEMLDEQAERMRLARVAEREREAMPLPAAHSASVWRKQHRGCDLDCPRGAGGGAAGGSGTAKSRGARVSRCGAPGGESAPLRARLLPQRPCGLPGQVQELALV